jgi:hypothetical protein
VLVIGCECGTLSTQSNGENNDAQNDDTQNGDNQNGDSNVVLTHRNQSDYDVWGYYDNNATGTGAGPISTKVVKRGEKPFLPDPEYDANSNTAGWRHEDGTSLTVNGVEYYTYYNWAGTDNLKEWIIGQPVESADVTVRPEDFDAAVIQPWFTEGSGYGTWIVGDKSYITNDTYNPSGLGSSISDTSQAADNVLNNNTVNNDGVISEDNDNNVDE